VGRPHHPPPPTNALVMHEADVHDGATAAVRVPSGVRLLTVLADPWPPRPGLP